VIDVRAHLAQEPEEQVCRLGEDAAREARHLLGGIGERAAEQPTHARRFGGGYARWQERRLDLGLQHVDDADRPAGADRLLQQAEAAHVLLLDGTQATFEHLPEQRALAAPIVGQHAEIRPGQPGDGTDGRAFVSMYAEQAFGGKEKARVSDLGGRGWLHPLSLSDVCRRIVR
jgi:hypothetical protein